MAEYPHKGYNDGKVRTDGGAQRRKACNNCKGTVRDSYNKGRDISQRGIQHRREAQVWGRETKGVIHRIKGKGDGSTGWVCWAGWLADLAGLAG